MIAIAQEVIAAASPSKDPATPCPIRLILGGQSRLKTSRHAATHALLRVVEALPAGLRRVLKLARYVIKITYFAGSPGD